MPIPPLSAKTTSPQAWRRPAKAFRNPLRRPTSVRGNGPRMPKDIKRLALIALGASIVIGGLGSIVILAWVAKDLPDPNKIIDRSIALSTKIYDRTGETVLYDVHGAEKRSFIALPELPKNLINATLTAEDRNFYQHKGLSITGIIRSVFKNITTGSRVGGSTLTQQLVKNAILTPEKTYTRKIKEWILSYQIEKKFSKEEILQMYFNEIPYGSVAYGAEAASQTYFGKSVKNVSLGEAAILAALPQAPTYYSPYGSHTDALFARQHWILDSMAELGYITEEDAEKAKQEQIEFAKARENITAPHFVMYVREYLTEKYGELVVEQGGLKVITTLDLYKQKIAEEAIAEFAERNEKTYSANNASLVAIDPKNGQIVSMVGSKDFFNEDIDGQVNVATRARQPGSSFKPIVYATAFTRGYTPDTVLYDVNTSFLNYDGKDYTPKNYDLREHGPVTIRKALAGSLNIPAVKAIYLAGIDNVIDFAKDLGYTTFSDSSRYGLSLVLGGGEVKLIEHVNAYATFAREGEWHPIVSILEVRDKDGNLLEEYQKREKKVLSTQTARQLNSILTDNAARAFIFGEKNYLTLPNRPVAAKTGTTNDYHDAWTVGYTPSLAAGVWVGNTRNEEMKRGADGSVVAAPIWNRFMSRVLGDTPAEGFNGPEPATTNNPALNGQLAAGVTVKVDKISGKLATNLTPESQVVERTYRTLHDILYYVDKDDPLNGTPSRQGQQFERWEAGVLRWAATNNIIAEEPPTEYDDVHTLADKPSIQITSPSAGQTITSRTISASINAQAPRGISRVEYSLNGATIATVTQAPYALNVTITDPSITVGSYTLRATAFDSIDNNQSDEVQLLFDLPGAPSAYSWTAPGPSQTISTFPVTLRANISGVEQISEINLYVQGPPGTNLVATVRQFPGGKLIASWPTKPDPGDYQIYAMITNTDGYTYKSSERQVVIK